MLKNRRSICLPSYDYTTSGAYFITICTHKREHSLGEIVNGEMKLFVIGKIVSGKWFDIPNHHDHVKLGEFIIMPNHIHGIIWIESNDIVGAHLSVSEEKFLDVRRSIIEDDRRKGYGLSGQTLTERIRK